MSESTADQAERMVPVAVALVGAVHDGGPQEVAAVLGGVAPVDRDALAVVLAAMVDPDCTVGDLLAWVTWDEHGRPMARPLDSVDWLTSAHRNGAILARLVASGGRHIRHAYHPAR